MRYGFAILANKMVMNAFEIVLLVSHTATAAYRSFAVRCVTATGSRSGWGRDVPVRTGLPLWRQTQLSKRTHVKVKLFCPQWEVRRLQAVLGPGSLDSPLT